MSVEPIIKINGSKNKLYPQIISHFPDNLNRLFIGFAGSMSVACRTDANVIYAAEKNPYITEFYRLVVDNPTAVYDHAMRLKEEYEKLPRERDKRDATVKKSPVTRADFYYLRRFELNDGRRDHKWAGIFMFMNRVCYNGLMRVNKKAGKFNVPHGRYKHAIIPSLERINTFVKWYRSTVKVMYKDYIHMYNAMSSSMTAGDVSYNDPPYSGTESMYTPDGFDRTAHIELASWGKKISKTGAQVFISNSNATLVKLMYKDYTPIEVTAVRTISRDSNERGAIKELLLKL